jgi:hypothetical protein
VPAGLNVDIAIGATAVLVANTLAKMSVAVAFNYSSGRPINQRSLSLETERKQGLPTSTFFCCREVAGSGFEPYVSSMSSMTGAFAGIMKNKKNAVTMP